MTRYINLSERGPNPLLPFRDLFVEVDDSGSVSREVGVDHAGRVVYKFPWLKRPGFRGSCDMASFSLGNVTDAITARQFAEYWNAPLSDEDEEKWIRAIQGNWLGRTLRRVFRWPS
jgi:hypothetical protein